MSEKYKLSYTAEQIDQRLGKAGSAISYDAQELTDEQKAQVRKNIGVAEKSEIVAEVLAEVGDNDTIDAVLYTPQTLTEEQKAQARANIGVAEGNGGNTGEIVAYRYGTVEMPALPAELGEYPYLYIQQPFGDNWVEIYGSMNPISIVYSESSNKTQVTAPCVLWWYDFDDESFSKSSQLTGEGNHSRNSYTFIWCNHDVKKGNTVIHAGSEPVPVYAGGGSGGSAADAVLYTEQNLTEEQQEQARKNIGITGTGADGHTPIKGVDYYTDGDKTEIVETVLDEIPKAIAMSISKADSTITVAVSLDDGTPSTSIITLDSNEYPINIVTDGVECSISWEGFDV